MQFDPIYSVEDKSVVITGGCGLIGRALVKSFHERGAKVLVADISQSEPEKFASEFSENVWGIECDVSNADEVKNLLEEAVSKLGSVDVLINNHQFKPQGFLEAQAENFPEQLWDDILRVNLKGTFLMCREFGNYMLENGKGSIINFASTYGVVSSNPALYADNSMGNPLAYTASKGGVIALTKYLGSYWASRGVRVNAVTPHGVWNNHEDEFVKRFSAMSPMNRLSKSDEVVGGVIYLASEASSYVTGSNLLIEGGWTAW